MSTAPGAAGPGARVVLPGRPLAETLAFLTERLGFRLDAIYPADDPEVALLSGHGIHLQLERDRVAAPGLIRLSCAEPAVTARVLMGGATACVAPNGTRFELVSRDPPLVALPSTCHFTLSRPEDGRPWVPGRAGMRYLDLIPGRQEGAIIASHIQIPAGGPVPDSVHHHRLHFQLIYCLEGWVRVVYEDQGEALLMVSGDCILQPPGIRHRVLESGPGLAVIEVSCPARHPTLIDHTMVLPNPRSQARDPRSRQRFVHHQARTASWVPGPLPGFERCETGISAATQGLGGVQILRRSGAVGTAWWRHEADVLFCFVLVGRLRLRRADGSDHSLSAGAAVVLPRDSLWAFADCSPELSLLVVSLPGSAGLAPLPPPD